MIVHPGLNTVLIMTSSTSTSTLISEFLSTMDADAEQGTQGRTMMETKLRLYLGWKGKLSGRREEGQGVVGWPVKNGETFQKEQGGDGVSEALKRKDQVMKERGMCRRRVRGGAPTAGSARGGDGGNWRKGQKDIITGEGEMRAEADRVANL